MPSQHPHHRPRGSRGGGAKRAARAAAAARAAQRAHQRSGSAYASIMRGAENVAPGGVRVSGRYPRRSFGGSSASFVHNSAANVGHNQGHSNGTLEKPDEKQHHQPQQPSQNASSVPIGPSFSSNTNTVRFDLPTPLVGLESTATSMADFVLATPKSSFSPATQQSTRMATRSTPSSTVKRRLERQTSHTGSYFETSPSSFLFPNRKKRRLSRELAALA